MTTEDDFQKQLDAHPDDHHTRLVFADWLDERGDPRGPGYRALGRLGKTPQYRKNGPNKHCPWEWWSLTNTDNEGGVEDSDYIPDEHWFAGIEGHVEVWGKKSSVAGCDSKDFATRRAAEDAAALAFAQLPDERQIKLLNPQEAAHAE